MSGHLLAPPRWPRGLPLDRARPPVPSFHREHVAVELEPGSALDLAAQLAAVHGLVARYWDLDGAEIGVVAGGGPEGGPLAVRYGLFGRPTLAEARLRAEAAIEAARLPGLDAVAPGGILLAAEDSGRFAAELARADLVVVASTGARRSLTCEYDADLFERDTVATFLHRCGDLLGRMGREPAARLWDDGVPGAARGPRLPAPLHPGRTVSQQCGMVARARPDAIALVANGINVTYAILDADASRIAAALRARGVRPGQVVALLSDGSATAASASIGIVRAGGVCLVVDVRDRPDHLAHVVRDSGAVLAVGAPRLAPSAVPCLDLALVEESPTPAPAFQETIGPGAALIVYTDAADGEVVRVRLEHASLVSILLDLAVRCGAAAGIDWPVRSRLASDRTLELWTGLLSGARCMLLPAVGGAFASGVQGISVYRPGALPLPIAVGRDSRSDGTLGAPLGGLRLEVLDREARPVAAGMLGELHVAGLGSTGDIARRRNDGSLQLVPGGRPALRTSWSRGDLAVIEDALRSHPLVADVVAVEYEAPGAASWPVAYVVPGADLAPDDVDEWLPAGCVTSDLVLLTALPRREDGVIDYALLPLPRADAPDAAPLTDVERTLVAMWTEILGVGRVGRHDDFFSLGGHSLLVMQLESRLRDAFGIDVPRRLLFERPTVAEVAPVVEELVAQQVDRLSDEEVLAALDLEAPADGA